jgi:hypothetical protein
MNQEFSYFFCLVIEGSRSGSGSRRPKNMWIRWILIRIRIPNTAKKLAFSWKIEDSLLIIIVFATNKMVFSDNSQVFYLGISSSTLSCEGIQYPAILSLHHSLYRPVG